MANNNSIKSLSLKTIKENLLPTLVSTVILMFCYFINFNISSVVAVIAGEAAAIIFSLILTLLILAPIFFGFLRYFWRLVCGVTENPIMIFYNLSSFKNYKKVLKISFSLFIRILVYYIILTIPALFIDFLASGDFFEFFKIPIPLWAANLTNVSLFLRFIAVTVTAFISLKYHIAPMLVVVNEDMDIDEAIHMSKVISKTTTIDFLFLIFSLLGWFVLSLFVFPLIFTIPYFVIIYLLHCSSVVAAFNETVKAINNRDFPTYTA